jgi:hypothetical protein
LNGVLPAKLKVAGEENNDSTKVDIFLAGEEA